MTGLSLSNSRGLGEYAGVTAAQDAAEHAAWACKNNYDSTTDAIRDARQELKELIESLRPWRKELLLAVFVFAGLGAIIGSFFHAVMAEIAAWLRAAVLAWWNS